MKQLIRWLAVLMLAFGLLPVVTAQEADAPTLEPFTDEAFGVQGIRPAGWTKAGPGLYARGSAAGDVALIAIQAAPVPADTLWTSLLPQLQLEAVPEAVGELTGEGLTWNLYQVDVTVGAVMVRVDLAVAEQDGTSYIVLLQMTPDDYDVLHESVFLPVVESLAPLVEEAVDLPYLIEEVTFDNGDITLAGTLTLPEVEGQHPAVVLMTGSGPQTRDEEVVPGFPIFELIADYLTRQGIAVLRYDDRGVGASTGTYIESSLQDFASDGQAAVNFLRTRADINADQVGLLGHSEGGLYTSIIGATPDNGVAFIIMMAGPAADGPALLLRQNELILAKAGASEAQIQSQLDLLNTIFPLLVERDYDGVAQAAYAGGLAQWETLTEAEREQSGYTSAEAFAQYVSDSFVAQSANEPFASLIAYDPTADLGQITVPVLAVFGGLDIQVDAEQSAPLLETILTESGNEDFTVLVLPDANHLFQAAEAGTLEEYGVLPGEFTAEFLPTIADWITARVDVITN